MFNHSTTLRFCSSDLPASIVKSLTQRMPWQKAVNKLSDVVTVLEHSQCKATLMSSHHQFNTLTDRLARGPGDKATREGENVKYRALSHTNT